MRTILAPVDFSDVTQLVADKAAEMAHALSARLHLLHIVEPKIDPISYYTDASFLGASPDFEDLQDEMKREETIMNALVEKYKKSGIEVVGEVKAGIPGSDILSIAEEMAPDMIVIGSHGHGALYHLFLGGVSEAVIYRAISPVLVVHAVGRSEAAQTAPLKESNPSGLAGA